MAQKQIAPMTQIIRTPINTESIASPFAGTVLSYGQPHSRLWGRPICSDELPNKNISEPPSFPGSQTRNAGGRLLAATDARTRSGSRPASVIDPKDQASAALKPAWLLLILPQSPVGLGKPDLIPCRSKCSDERRPVNPGLRKRLSLPFKKVAKCSQRLKTVADNLSNRQHGHRKDPARNTPHPEPEDERDDDEDGIEGEPSRQKHRR